MVTLRFTLPGSESEALLLDAALSEQHSSSAEVTQFPVETGADISDHVCVQPDRVRLEGMVSNAPVQDVGGSLEYRQAEGVKDGFSFSRRAEEAYQKLKRLLATGVPISILTDLRAYENMVMRSLDVPRAVELGDVVRFMAEFQEVVTVSTQLVTLQRARRGEKISGGRKPAQKVEPAKAERPRSAAKALKQSLLSTLGGN